ncbi:MAG: bifunctional DNA-formamidopyrimidine glycosylase/DNA-(apurinic or apyrimidinic site) lyase [Pseudomonadota bacterium]|nr:bifunctional DNA-formamidopyrimidine glycosylase/DNA-(apurinic or apyrimidinic site) lyase [Pseudomonadota bacterium]
MPELPEVEVTRRGIAAPLLGASIQSFRMGKPLRWPLNIEPAMVAGARIGAITRRGKYLWMPLERGAAPAGGLLLHLGMSGSLMLLAPPAIAPAGVHDHFDLITDRGTLRLNDPRRFGAVLWSAALDTAPALALLARLGPEPFDEALTPARFHAALHTRSAAVKSVLLSGVAVVGAGNIYACEALFLAGIHPALRADRVSRPRAERLLAALRMVLGRALELGGSTLRDFSDAHGVSGAYQSQAAVYGRAGLPCLRCGTPIRRVLQLQRSTFYCPVCQRR